MSSSGSWSDLRARLVTGGLLAAGGVIAMLLGGWVFLAVTALVGGIMIWEVARMIAPEKGPAALGLAILAGAVILIAPSLPGPIRLPIGLASAAVGAAIMPRNKLLFFGFSLAIQVAAYGLSNFRAEHGVLWLVWLVLVVVATDVAGYFAGRHFGGKKFWPGISPKKTWSGTIAGWVSAAVIGAVFLTFTNAGADLIWISMLLSFASQMGDIAESALKRTMGVKDSSNLLPGHGGLFDRFDGLLGASLFMLLTAQLTTIPGIAT